MEAIKVKYRNGLPTEKSMKELIKAFWTETLYAPRINASYKYTSAIIWDKNGVNEKIPEFIGFLKSNGIGVQGYQLYNSPSMGHITLKKINQ